ncbi:bifunctional [glutamate--ammonia ligase]-adenylyl-L-tyrosine phosphorylase/[glutamate--ammonia-ligase] adenylyltransferase [uncultured Methylibium sp.]|uniref:bifunctional [glutamate--ammonia ligase]-adenylyl-L-tyrosine phosphorylase/[glutamate--ammonia-ligase] adenylyltransferase n=1 Tax=uncultured Methylibium sp. TaxID=381093 RepID=UPI0025D27A98|nr:bifunctional [glutamate--ammonia ligase]-adenylyl-L-tyrosine phosphorylase/[glutamate--ammonia-ligase] adenylyltransferase [uncultured Methylibium sp.]
MRSPVDTACTNGALHSRFVQRIRRRYADALTLLGPGVPAREAIDALIDALVAGGQPLPAALRVARHVVIERLAVLDVEQQAPLEAVTRTMSELAEVTLDRALAAAFAEQDARHGAPLKPDGRRSAFWVVGMGKLGAHELNVSSDIDLIYVYEDDVPTAGRADGQGVISAHEYFSQVARSLYALIGDVTDDGQVFRVDLALRPNGNSGPAVVSLAMLEEYFLVQGREWERFAWLKSRVVAPAAAMTSGEALPLRDLVVAFVYRRYLDYGVFEGLRQLHRKIREEAAKRAAGRPERANDVKLSRGGIREIEFIVQLLQVVRGGQFPELRTRSTLKALDRLVAVGVMKPETAVRLAEAYRFLRQVEHRIQYLDDRQTHLLPTEDADLAWIGRSMRLECNADACELLDRLCGHREFVATEFDALLHDGRSGSAPEGCRNCGGPPPALDSEAFLERLPPEVAERVRHFAAGPKVAMLRDETRTRLAKLIGRAAMLSDELPAGPAEPQQAVLRFIDWIEPLLRRESYLALLAERPEVLGRLLRLLGLAKWPMRYLMRHPGVIDELADARALQGRFDRVAFLRDLNERHSAWTRGGQADEEALLDTLRRAHHAEVFRTLVRDVEGQLTVEQVADDLSALADATLDCTIRWAWQHLKQRHREAPRLAVVAYGKLGGKELGYGSDLDVVFLYDDADEADPDKAAEVYAAFVRKLITWLTLRTAAGDLFDIDTALRPNGNSGLLVTSIGAFERYQAGRGSNTAWTWEHQAITRARWCAGDATLAPRVEAARRGVLAAVRDPDALRQEVSAMRERVRAAHPAPRRDGQLLFDVKHGEGGMMDVEFAVQVLVLAHSARHAGLRDDIGNIALLRLAEQLSLLPAGVGNAAADAYRELRRAQHRARLDEAPTQFDVQAFAAERAAVQALSRAVFG